MRQLNVFVFSLLCLHYFGKLVEAKHIDGIDTSKQTYDILLQRLERLESKNKEMEIQINKFQKKFEMKELIFTKQISELERQNSLLRKSTEKDCKCFTERNDHDENVGYYNTSRPQNDGKLETKLHEHTRDDQSVSIDQRKRLQGMLQNNGTPTMEVAFFATVTQHDVLHLGVNQNIVFDKAVANKGNAYHITHGIFTAPVDGTYVFCTTVHGSHTSGNHYAHVDINGKSVAKLITSWSQSTQMIVVELHAGDDVSIKNDIRDGQILGDMFSAFSGFLLYQNFGSSENAPGK